MREEGGRGEKEGMEEEGRNKGGAEKGREEEFHLFKFCQLESSAFHPYKLCCHVHCSDCIHSLKSINLL